jgi:archaellum biogenesis ATPase FlaH
MNVDEIRKWHKTFKRDDELFEIRLLGDRTWSGYFYDVEQAIHQLQPFDNLNIYFSVNEVKRACASRSQFGCFQQVKGTATSKQDIEHRWWIPIDVDCERPSGVSSTNEEKELAHKKAGDVFRFLKSNGFSEPIVCDSSSGYHIFIPVDIENTPDAELTIKTFLETLGSNFTDENVKIDNVLFDANRIIRLPGSFGRKGRNTDERPHRQAKILYVPSTIVRMHKDFFDAFNDRYKVVTEQPIRRYNNFGNNNREEFNLRNFISSNGISVAKEIPLPGGGTKYVLTECLFDSGHKAPDAAIFEMPNGAIAYKCFHNSCAGHDWREVRLKFDPHAYDQRPSNYQPMVAAPQQQTGQRQQQPVIKPETPELGKKWFSMKDIQKVNINDIEHVKTGFRELDKSIRGLFFSSLLIISGSNASGKSSWLNTLVLNAIQQNYKAALWSGELRPDVLKTWIQMVAAGKEHLLQAANGQYWYVSNDISQKIDDWMDGKFFLYNNEYSNKWEQLFADMKELLAIGVRIFILDNLFSLDIDVFNGDNNKKQKELINQLVEFKKKHKALVVLVAHPRKTTSFIRKYDISGTSAIMDAADYIFIVHRVNNDFRKSVGDFYGQRNAETFFNFSNVIEVAKDRMMGTQDYLVGMYYEVESRRFKNTNEERIVYGWRGDIGTQQAMFVDEPMQPQQIENDRPFGDTLPESELPF